MPSDQDLRTMLANHGGVAPASRLVELLTKRGLRDAVERGVVVRVARGRYALPDLDEAVAAATRLSGTLSHRSAALHHRWSVATAPDRPEIVVPRKRRVAPARREGVEVRWRDLPQSAANGSGPVPATTPVQTVIDCARDLPWSEALAVADSALRRRAVTPAELLAAAEATRTSGRTQALRVAARADGRAANGFESVLRSIALDVPGLRPVPQHLIDERGLRIRPDLADPDRRIAIEAESWQFHGHRSALHADCGRYNALALRGWVLLRFSWEHVMLQPSYVRDVLLAAVGCPDGQAALTTSLVWAP